MSKRKLTVVAVILVGLVSLLVDSVEEPTEEEITKLVNENTRVTQVGDVDAVGAPSHPENEIVRPDTKIIVNEAYEYLGDFKFEMVELVTVERLVFAKFEGKAVQSMIVIQIEEVLEGVDFEYVWSVRNPVRLGQHDYQHGTFFFDTAQAIKNNLGKEMDMTMQFLEQKAVPFVRGWMASRYARITDDAGRSELIIFYMEPIETTGNDLEDFGADGKETPLCVNFSKGLVKRGLEAFRVL